MVAPRAGEGAGSPSRFSPGEGAWATRPELRRTLVSLWERWSDKKEVEEEFALLMLSGRWHAGLPDKDLNRLPKEAVLEGMEI